MLLEWWWWYRNQEGFLKEETSQLLSYPASLNVEQRLTGLPSVARPQDYSVSTLRKGS